MDINYDTGSSDRVRCRLSPSSHAVKPEAENNLYIIKFISYPEKKAYVLNGLIFFLAEIQLEWSIRILTNCVCIQLRSLTFQNYEHICHVDV